MIIKVIGYTYDNNEKVTYSMNIKATLLDGTIKLRKMGVNFKCEEKPQAGYINVTKGHFKYLEVGSPQDSFMYPILVVEEFKKDDLCKMLDRNNKRPIYIEKDIFNKNSRSKYVEQKEEKDKEVKKRYESYKRQALEKEKTMEDLFDWS